VSGLEARLAAETAHFRRFYGRWGIQNDLYVLNTEYNNLCG